MKRVVISSLTIILLLFAEVALSAEGHIPYPSNSRHLVVGLMAMKKVNWDWRPGGWTIKFYPGRKNYLGMTNEKEREILIWIRPEHSPTEVAASLVHELAHAFDLIYLTPELRKDWLKARGLPPATPWYSCDECSDYKSGSGDFAESVSWTLQGANGARFRSKLGQPPNEEQQALIKKWIAMAGN